MIVIVLYKVCFLFLYYVIIHKMKLIFVITFMFCKLFFVIFYVQNHREHSLIMETSWASNFLLMLPIVAI